MTKTQGTTIVVLFGLLLGAQIVSIALAFRSNPVHLSAENATAYPVYLSRPIELSKEEAPAWEYRIEGVPDVGWDTTMKVIGDEGWELVFARRAQGENDQMLYEAIFKRQKRG